MNFNAEWGQTRSTRPERLATPSGSYHQMPTKTKLRRFVETGLVGILRPQASPPTHALLIANTDTHLLHEGTHTYSTMGHADVSARGWSPPARHHRALYDKLSVVCLMLFRITCTYVGGQDSPIWSSS